MNEEVQLKEKNQPEEEVQSKKQEVQEEGEAQERDAVDEGTERKGTFLADAPPTPPSMPMIIVLGLIAMISGALVVLVYQYTKPIIEEKERLALEAAVFQVVPGVDAGTAQQTAFFIDAEGELIKHTNKETKDKAKKEGKEPFYAVYGSSDTLLGFAMQGAAQGYQDIVRTLFGYDADKQQIVGMTILKSVDTPGLGDKKTVEKNESFMANFDALDVSLTGDKSAIAHPIETVKHGAKTNPWQVDAMSGATITSRAIAKGMRDTMGELLPLLVKHLATGAFVRSAATEVEN